jgi:methyl-accepting chemotaxis protein
MSLKTRTKLILMGAVPTLALLYFAVSGTVDKAAVAAEMTKLEALVEVSVKIGELTHELQKERGLSAGFISSKGARNVAELPAQRVETDKKSQVLGEALKSFDAARYGDELKALLGSAESNLQELAAKRSAVSALRIEAPESAAYYTKTIAGFLKAPAAVSTLSSSGEISRLSSAYSSLLEAKERAGRERAMLAAVFTVDKFTPATLTGFLKNLAAQEVYIDEFFHYALDRQKAFFKEKIAGQVVEEVARIKKLAADGASQPALGVDPAHWFKASTDRINLLKEVENRLADDLLGEQARLKSSANSTMTLFIVLTIVAVLVTAVLAIYLTRSILRQLGGEPDYAADITRNIATGKLDNHIEVAAGDTGSLVASIRSMQEQLLQRITADKKIADENLRIRIALDNVSTGVMIADNDRTIIYANKSVLGILKGAEASLRKQLPSFDASKVMGENIDSFHKNPAHQANLLATFTSTYTANLEVGGSFLRVIASPVSNDLNERLGVVAEWHDRTAEVTVEREVAAIVEGALRGDFDQRLTLEGKTGFFKQLAEGLNKLSETTSTGLNDVAGALQAMAQGDLTRKIEAEYQGIFGQLKDDTNTTVARLCEVVGRIKEATEAINIASQEIAAGNQDLSGRTEQQASSLEETASAMEQLNSTVRLNADNAKHAQGLAQATSTAAARGGEMVKGVVVTMNGIQGSSKKISDIIGVIDSIAFQTNILALNAAVEAARAGEQGRGFAVVATEVRNLAQRSATAAKEIATLIAESVEQVESGVELVNQAGQSIDKVVEGFQEVAGLVTEIASASREQSSGIEQTTQAVSQMDEVTQQNAALVEEAAAAAESLEEQARGLVQAVRMFKLPSDGGSRQSAALLRTIPQPTRLGGGKTANKASKGTPARLAKSDESWEEF